MSWTSIKVGSISLSGEENAEMIVHGLPLNIIFIYDDIVEWREGGGFKGARENDGSFSILRGPALPLLRYALDLVFFEIWLLSQDYVDLVLWHHLPQLTHRWLAFVQIALLQDSKGWL
ncbi:hypothetical protein AVEN_235605-1 [Araneus ventricosus]|uniref:Uncharacterized protein n=1 Tax=Araneus ventricosus TaxID=182803 RepID=A0A4Y2BT71_ARAVE|nr:hypothetical protein AVEN_235605-1 [Araneus ventricosus]